MKNTMANANAKGRTDEKETLRIIEKTKENVTQTHTHTETHTLTQREEEGKDEQHTTKHACTTNNRAHLQRRR